ncbi:MAG: ABC transporter permease [Sediminibacterium sp.]|nr:ABC transporter permease [Sediminibacterium sp.]MDP3128228.1 ABC transporter permease [Sediminibacterium sp.]
MDGLQRLLKKLIRSGAGRNRFALAITGLSVAMLLILAAVQIQSNYHDLLHSKTNQDSIANFLVLNKILTDQNMGATALSDSDINDLKQQPFVESVGLLSPGRFKASIQSYSDRFPFYTDIAFESVPKDFIDVAGKDWIWKENQQLVPVIVPNMFLDFYNFQFSFSQNLPQLTQQVVKMIIFKINLYGPDGIVSFNGQVVGFSDRISSLLVPQEFMEWANNRFGKNKDTKPSRVIISTKDPGNPILVQYLKAKNLSTDADKTRFSRYRQVVDLVVTISGITGVIMLAFALLIFSLFIQLTIVACKEEIILLITLGASPKQLRKFLMKQFFPVNVLIVLVSIGIIAILQYAVHHQLLSRHIYVNALPSYTVLIAALTVLMVTWWVNRYFIRKYISLSAK